MEFWDVLDEHGSKTGRTIVRGEKLKPGEFYLAVHIWIRNGRGEYLIQKRTDDKPLWPGLWAATGGAVVSGESSLEAALRETEEELGIRPVPGRMHLLGRLKRADWFTDLWLLNDESDLKDITLQAEEVSDARWASLPEIKSMIAEKTFVAYDYLAMLPDMDFS